MMSKVPIPNQGYVTLLLYPESPLHPRQKYLFTAKRLAVFQTL